MAEFPDIKLDPKKTALLIVDMQNEFILRDFGEALQFKEAGEWERWIPFHDRLDDITIPACKKLLDYFRQNDMYVTFGRIACLLENGEDRCMVQKSEGWNGMLLSLIHILMPLASIYSLNSIYDGSFISIISILFAATICGFFASLGLKR